MTSFLDDILNQPDELLKILRRMLGAERAQLEEAAGRLARAAQIYVTGIGSSWHAGMAVAAILQQAGRPASLFDASEMLHFAEPARGSAAMVLSRSGQSTEIVQLVEKLRRRGCDIVAVTNTPDSPLAKGADATLLLGASFDHMVSVTMYSGIALAGGLVAAVCADGFESDPGERLAESIEAAKRALPGWSRQVEDSDWFSGEAPAYFLARGASLASCHETELIWEEAAKSPATAMTTGGFRHGSQEMLREGMRIGLWIDGERLRGEDLALAADLRKLGARVMLIGQDLPAGAGELTFTLPPVPARWQFVTEIIPAQLAAERLSRARGVNCDEFRICPYIVEDEGGLLGRIG
jgi:glucosamine--fructose-6-phosphate aminotransferase (isomerizing)